MTMNSLILNIFSLLLLLRFVTICWSAHQDPLSSLSAANNDFGTRLFNALRQTNNENIFFSPLSLSIAFGMLYHGAGGYTARELSEVLGYQRAGLHNRDRVSYAFGLYMKRTWSSPEFELNLANRIVVDRSVNLDDQYRSDMHRLYDSAVENADFRRDGAAIKNKINSWVNHKTKGMIPTLLDRVDPSDVMVILNAAYFKGLWDKPFDPKMTSPQYFHNFGTTPKMVQMMVMDNENFDYFSWSTFSALELPYKGNMSMLILLPHSKIALPSLEDSLSASSIDHILSRLQPRNLNVHLPKFRSSFSFSLQDSLQRLGMRSVFGTGADFSGISRSKGIMVSEVVHKASVTVDEGGTEAAAATAIRMTSFSRLPQAIEFVVDRPFLYAIIDRNRNRNVVLFMGRVCQI